MGRMRNQVNWNDAQYIRALGEVILDPKNANIGAYVKALRIRFPLKSFTNSSVANGYRRTSPNFTEQFTKEEVQAIHARYADNAVRSKKKAAAYPRMQRVREGKLVALSLPSKPLPPETDTLAPLRTPDGQLYTNLNIGAGMCQWPYSDPGQPDFALCGRPAKGSYCPEHTQKARGKLQPRQKAATTRLDDELQQVWQRDLWK